MRALKYARFFSSSTADKSDDATSNDRNDAPTSSVEATSTPQPRKRKSGLSAVENADDPDIAVDAPPPRREDESDIFSEALSEAEDSVDPDDVLDYRRLHRVSFAQRPPRPDYNFKVCIVGNVNVGKTTLLLTLTDGGGGSGGVGDAKRQTPKVGV